MYRSLFTLAGFLTIVAFATATFIDSLQQSQWYRAKNNSSASAIELATQPKRCVKNNSSEPQLANAEQWATLFPSYSTLDNDFEYVSSTNKVAPSLEEKFEGDGLFDPSLDFVPVADDFVESPGQLDSPRQFDSQPGSDPHLRVDSEVLTEAFPKDLQVDGLHQNNQANNWPMQHPGYVHAQGLVPQPEMSHQRFQGYSDHPAMSVDQYSLFDYRRMMINSRPPEPHELVGRWRGTNKGIATLAIDKNFIKDFEIFGEQVRGDNIPVKQSGPFGWEPSRTKDGQLKRQGRFAVQNGRGVGAYGHGLSLNYRKGNNRLLDPANLIRDEIVKLDDNHMLGRATVRLGPIKIPLAFFVLERIE